MKAREIKAGAVYYIPAHGYLPARGVVGVEETHRSRVRFWNAGTAGQAVNGQWLARAGETFKTYRRTVLLDPDREVVEVETS